MESSRVRDPFFGCLGKTAETAPSHLNYSCRTAPQQSKHFTHKLLGNHSQSWTRCGKHDPVVRKKHHGNPGRPADYLGVGRLKRPTTASIFALNKRRTRREGTGQNRRIRSFSERTFPRSNSTLCCYPPRLNTVLTR